MNSNEIIADLTQPKTIDQSVEMINNTKKRDLTDWNLAEHYESKVLVQVNFKIINFELKTNSNKILTKRNYKTLVILILMWTLTIIDVIIH